MHRIVAALIVLFIPAPLAGSTPSTGPRQAESPTEQYQAIVKEFSEAAFAIRNTTTDEERNQVAARIATLPIRLLELAEKHPDDPIAIDALTQVVTQEYWLDNYSSHPGWGQESPQVKAIAILLRNHLHRDKLGESCRRVHYGFRQECEMFLRTVLQQSPHRDVRGLACLRLAQFLKHRWARLDLMEQQPELMRRYEKLYGKEYLDRLTRQDRAQAMAEAEAILQRAMDEFGDVKVPYGTTVRNAARLDLHEIRYLSVGKHAPDIEGTDQDGIEFKLSDYRGKVVLLYFWQQF